jgi:hypothetical protein
MVGVSKSDRKSMHFPMSPKPSSVIVTSSMSEEGALHAEISSIATSTRKRYVHAIIPHERMPPNSAPTMRMQERRIRRVAVRILFTRPG